MRKATCVISCVALAHSAKVFTLKVDFLWEFRQNNFERVTTPESVSLLLELRN